jgi:hypothetical protein
MRDFFDFIKIHNEQGKRIPIIVLEGSTFYLYRIHQDSACRTSWTVNRKKYVYSLWGQARIAKERMERKGYPQWYIEENKNLYIDSIFNCMMHWLPGIDVNIKEVLKKMKEQGVYPCRVKKSKEEKQKTSFKEKIITLYRDMCFKYPFLYKIYYKQMSKKYKKVEKQDKE